MKSKDLLKKAAFIFESLSLKPKIGGLEISDSILQYVLLNGAAKTFFLRLPPNVIKGGKIIDGARFLDLLRRFHDMIEPNKKAIQVIVVLPPDMIYSQTFNIPNVGESRLNESAGLNLEMLSPLPKEEVYMSWQMLGEMIDHYELFGAFAERKTVDGLKNILEQANFAPIAFEFPSLALARLVADNVAIPAVPTLVFRLSSDGLDFFIFRNGSIYFDYFRSWQSIQGESREISRAVFEKVLEEEVQKVINFSLARFKEPLAQVLLVVPGLEKDIKTFLENRFGLKTISLEVGTPPLAANWHVAFGAALRGSMDRGADKFISLAPLPPAKLFYQERVLEFLKLWRSVLAGVLFVFLLLYGGAASLLVKELDGLQERIGIFRIDVKLKELESLKTKTEEFNSLVNAIGAVRGPSARWSYFFERLKSLADSRRIILDRIEVTSRNNSVSLSAKAPDYDTITSFKDVLSAEKGFSNIDLAVSKIIVLADNSIGFTLTFQYAQP